MPLFGSLHKQASHDSVHSQSADRLSCSNRFARWHQWRAKLIWFSSSFSSHFISKIASTNLKEYQIPENTGASKLLLKNNKTSWHTKPTKNIFSYSPMRTRRWATWTVARPRSPWTVPAGLRARIAWQRRRGFGGKWHMLGFLLVVFLYISCLFWVFWKGRSCEGGKYWGRCFGIHEGMLFWYVLILEHSWIICHFVGQI